MQESLLLIVKAFLNLLGWSSTFTLAWLMIIGVVEPEGSNGGLFVFFLLVASLAAVSISTKEKG